MNEAARELVSAAAERFGEKAFTVEPNAKDDAAEPGSVVLVFRHPNRSHHCVEVLQRGDTFEVAYSDGEPPGPAEQLFVCRAPGQQREAIREVIAFLADIFSGQVIVWRERVGPITRLLRGRDCDSLLWFSRRDDVTPDRKKRLVVLHEWRQG